jgi:tight adherence protein C
MDKLQTFIFVLIVISAAVFVFSLVVMLMSRYGKEKDAFQQRLEKVAGTKSKLALLDEDLEKPLSERFVKPITDKMLAGVRKVAPATSTDGEPSDSRSLKLKKSLRQAGMKIGVSEYRTIRLLVMGGLVLGVGLLVFLFSGNVLYAVLGGLLGLYMGYVGMRFNLSSRATARKNSMQRQLPEVLDMISISVEAGLGLEQAMIEVVNNFEGPLIDEFAVTNREMTMGRSRNDALLLLGERCDIEEMMTFTRAIIQATQMGIAVKNVLRSQAEYMRQTRKNKIEEKAMQISVKILIPMALFILPVIFIVLLGPAVVSIMEAFS